MTNTILDSGSRTSFETGAVRDIQEGKGRCDLLPLDTLADMMGDDILYYINSFVRDGNTLALQNAVERFAEREYGSLFSAMLEVAIHYESGCHKYGERNWEKGIPVHSFVDSGVRHYLKFLRGDSDERHDRAFIWNMLGALWTMEHREDMIDIPGREAYLARREAKAIKIGKILQAAAAEEEETENESEIRTATDTR